MGKGLVMLGRDLTRFVPHASPVVIPLEDVASCEQQSLDDIRVPVAYGKVRWGGKACVLYVDLGSGF